MIFNDTLYDEILSKFLLLTTINILRNSIVIIYPAITLFNIRYRTRDEYSTQFIIKLSMRS